MNNNIIWLHLAYPSSTSRPWPLHQLARDCAVHYQEGNPEEVKEILKSTPSQFTEGQLFREMYNQQEEMIEEEDITGLPT